MPLLRRHRRESGDGINEGLHLAQPRIASSSIRTDARIRNGCVALGGRAALCRALAVFGFATAAAEAAHAIAMHGAPAMPDRFAVLPYAPKGGLLTQGSLEPSTVSILPPSRASPCKRSALMVESLMARL